jgi:spore coat protein U-like protein
MTRFLLTLCCALLPLSAWAQRAKPPPGECPLTPAQCQVNAQVFNFGRHQMSETASAIDSNSTISVTCTRVAQEGLSVTVEFELKGLPPDPARQMRDAIGGGYLRYLMFVDPARTRYWGDGSQGTSTFQGACFLDNRNRVCTIPFLLYGRVDGGQVALPGQWLGAVVSRLEYRFIACIP